MKLADLHCDTPYELYKRKTSLYDGNTAFTVEKCEKSDIHSVLQVMAFWSDPKRSPDECYSDFFAMFENLGREIEECSLKTSAELPAIILSIEGARLVGSNLSRLAVLREYGVRVLAPVWGGNELCGGAYDSEEGLTDFGKKLIKECETLGITIDVSHMSEKSFWDTVNISQKPIVATHSNAAAICGHRRNLSDTQVRTIAGSGGVIGVSVCAKHIAGKYAEVLPDDAELFVKEFCDHIEHYIGLGDVVSGCICLGCDFDGTQTSVGITDVSCMTKVEKELLARGIGKGTAEGVMWKNAVDFFDRILK